MHNLAKRLREETEAVGKIGNIPYYMTLDHFLLETEPLSCLKGSLQTATTILMLKRQTIQLQTAGTDNNNTHIPQRRECWQ